MGEDDLFVKENNISYELFHNERLCMPENFTEPEELYLNLKQRILKYHPSTDLKLIEKAYEVARHAHEGQVRKSGEPYIIHPLCVGLILADLKLDKESICAGLLHDVVEDTEVSLEDLRDIFGEELAFLVDGVTKLGRLSSNVDTTEEQGENLRKMFVAMSEDIRVILIKLADRLHNIRTLNFRKPEKQIKVARETLDIYAPLAQRLGISKIKVELDDLSLQYLKKEEYTRLYNILEQTRPQREQFIGELVELLRKVLSEADIKCIVAGHIKHLFSIYRRMLNQQKTTDQISDVFTIQIIVNTVSECYEVLGIIHDYFKPVPGKFKDFIAMPKTNNYQSIHTTLVAPSGRMFDVQIRTHEMHLISQYGITAHWKYQEEYEEPQIPQSGKEKKLAWLKQILEWQKDMSDNKEFISLLKSDFNLLSERILCFTPKGDVKSLPYGANPIDFAYSIHTAIGNKMIGARVNNAVVPMDYVINNGDRVEIVTSQNSSGPCKEWLDIVKTTEAKNKITQWFRNAHKEEDIKIGYDKLQSYCSLRGFDLTLLLKRYYMAKVIRKYGYDSWDSVLAAIGHGELKEGQVIHKMVEEYESQHNKLHFERAQEGIIIKDVENPTVRFSKCCCPVPGDEIIGYITRGRGISIHRTDCINIMNLTEEERKNIVEVEWQFGQNTKKHGVFFVELHIVARNELGIIAGISEILLQQDIDIEVLNSKVGGNKMAFITMSFQVKNREQLENVIQNLKEKEYILSIDRSVS